MIDASVSRQLPREPIVRIYVLVAPPHALSAILVENTTPDPGRRASAAFPKNDHQLHLCDALCCSAIGDLARKHDPDHDLDQV